MICSFLFCLFLTIQLTQSFTYKLTILHTNDLHSRVDETTASGGLCFKKERVAGKCYGGASRRATIVQKIRREQRNVVLLDAGDAMTGTIWYDVTRGNATWKTMNELGYDAMALGNHDFDDGPAHTAQFLKRLNFSVVMSNVNASKEKLFTEKLYVRQKVLHIGGEMVGVVGYVLPSTPFISKPGPGPNIQFSPEISSLQSAVNHLQQQGVNKIIAVGHSGIAMDKMIAAQVSGLAVVVGGHSNTFLYSGTPQIKTLRPKGPYPSIVLSNDGQRVPVVQAYAYGIYLGRLDLEFNSKGKVTKWAGQPILLDSTVSKDTKMEQLVNSMRPKVEQVSQVMIGRSLVLLNGERNVCGLKECNLGNLVTDSMVFYYANTTSTAGQWTQVSIAITTSSSITASIDVAPQGHITYGHTINSLPYRNTLDMVSLQGNALKQVLEQSVLNYDGINPQGSFLQISGIKVQFDVSKQPGQRVTSVQVMCSQCRIPSYKPLNATAVYSVIVTSYLASGGAGYSMIKDKRLSYQAGSVRDYQAFSEYIRAFSPVMTGLEGRIVFEESTAVESKATGYYGYHWVWMCCFITALALTFLA